MSMRSGKDRHRSVWHAATGEVDRAVYLRAPDGLNMTPAQARELAAALVELADGVERGPGCVWQEEMPNGKPMWVAMPKTRSD